MRMPSVLTVGAPTEPVRARGCPLYSQWELPQSQSAREDALCTHSGSSLNASPRERMPSVLTVGAPSMPVRATGCPLYSQWELPQCQSARCLCLL
jgi:hypothetical protein